MLFIKNIIYKIFIGLPKKIFFTYIKLHREKIIFAFPNLFRFSSKPYISGDSFRKISKHILDDGKRFNPKKVKAGDIVFVQSNFINEYFLKFSPLISEKHILISHNNYEPVEDRFVKKIDSKVSHWFAENLNTDCQNSKLSALPLGLENLRYLKNGIRSHYKTKKVKFNILNKDQLVLSSFAPHTNPERRDNISIIANNLDYVDIRVFKNHNLYIQNLSRYKFNICPPGMGYDTHRFWESLIVKCIPIVINNNVIKHFSNIGIPMLVVEKWEEMYKFNAKDLENIYSQLSPLLMQEKYLYLEYWISEIKKKQNKLISK